MSQACYHKCTTFTKPIQLSKKEFVSAFYVSTNEKSSHRAAAGRKWKNKFRKSVRAVVFNQTCASIYNLSMIAPLAIRIFQISYFAAWQVHTCLCFDFMGTIPDDTSDEQGTVMVPRERWERNDPNPKEIK